ncbi:helix-turn-helix transcriptional regulator [Vibrio genomosp. F10]|uniref:helix-turn-helix transcriptional regulator n=1 Tax=Vibrio genomosp. F10 TaxID=723171 RepID=UPI0002EDD416|nr:LuxR family transcriptional regulator [Vibrio genomosp. F10]OEF03956.1 hypothetical protein A1QI_12415 [Vibrio genomosp. F10 str. 9ZB36]
MREVLEIIQQLQTADDIQTLDNILSQFAQSIELEHFAFGVAYPESIQQNEVNLMHNYPKEWMDFYLAEGYMKKDALVNHGLNYHTPIIWSEITKKNGYNNEQVAIMKEGSENGLSSGFSLPVHGTRGEFGLLNFAGQSSNSKASANYDMALPYAQVILPAVLDTLQRIRRQQPDTIVKLTKRETECLSWVTEGKSSWEIAKIIGCAERTVIFHLNNAMLKLNATNRYQAISKAIFGGLIVPAL